MPITIAIVLAILAAVYGSYSVDSTPDSKYAPPAQTIEHGRR